jgi:hypothetical protein
LKHSKKGNVTPALDNAPILFPHLAHIFAAFKVLDASRMWNTGNPNPIQLSEIQSYGLMHNFSGEDLRELVRHVQKLDRKYMEHEAEKRERESKK